MHFANGCGHHAFRACKTHTRFSLDPRDKEEGSVPGPSHARALFTPLLNVRQHHRLPSAGIGVQRGRSGGAHPAWTGPVSRMLVICLPKSKIRSASAPQLQKQLDCGQAGHHYQSM
eukprot:1137188-Pelagomonas_calceolata.AAC.5